MTVLPFSTMVAGSERIEIVMVLICLIFELVNTPASCCLSSCRGLKSSDSLDRTHSKSQMTLAWVFAIFIP